MGRYAGRGRHDGTGSREATFRLINGVTLKGGYAGFGKPDPNARDTELYETILSGDLHGNDTEIDDPCDLWTDLKRSDNSYHVVTVSENNVNPIVDGVTIAGGHANENYPSTNCYGGGVYSGGGSARLISCKFSGNSALYGGGMYNNAGQPALISCTFDMNFASYGGGMHSSLGQATLLDCTFSGNSGISGGAMANTTSSPKLTNCTFRRNIATSGGGIGNWDSSPELIGCILSGNSAASFGGGMANVSSKPILANCILSGNSAVSGGGMSNVWSNPTLTGCTLSGNSAASAGGGVDNYDSSLVVNNSILWGDTPDEISVAGGAPGVTCSNVEGGWPGKGNIDADPCFVDLGYYREPVRADDRFWADGDYHLRSQGGRWDRNSQSWVQDGVTSPCIDAGDMSTPVGSERFPNGGVINMGAYGGTLEASQSYFGRPVCRMIVAGDTNGDCRVDFNDFSVMAFHWLSQR